MEETIRHGSLFTGIGGFDLAAQWMGWNNVFQVEIDQFCQKVLTKNFPNVERYKDIKEFDGTKYRGAVDIISGGFPCQPFSQSGKRKGTADDRYLWPEMLRIIGEVQPGWVVGENVRGITNWSKGLVFDQVQADLEAQGYQVLPFLLPACAVNAPHRRDRLWFISYSKSNGNNRIGQLRDSEWTCNKEEDRTVLKVQAITNSNCNGLKECWPKWFTSRELTQDYGLTSEPGICRGDDGFPYRVDRLKALGNAIVPQVALQIFKAINLHAASYGWR